MAAAGTVKQAHDEIQDTVEETTLQRGGALSSPGRRRKRKENVLSACTGGRRRGPGVQNLEPRLGGGIPKEGRVASPQRG